MQGLQRDVKTRLGGVQGLYAVGPTGVQFYLPFLQFQTLSGVLVQVRQPHPIDTALLGHLSIPSLLSPRSSLRRFFARGSLRGVKFGPLGQYLTSRRGLLHHLAQDFLQFHQLRLAVTV